jgi:membrane complex biogenesis BtpA family protein
MSSRGLDAILSRRKLLLGMVHLKPLPGSPRHGGEALSAIAAAARADAAALLEAGFDGYVLENFGDAPFFASAAPPHVIAAMTRVACDLPRQDAFVAVNVLRNDAAGALAIAAALELDGIRVNIHTGAAVTDQGLISGQAAETLRLRSRLGAPLAILADVAVKHSQPLAAAFDIKEAARDTAYRGLADALIVTGKATGAGALIDDVLAVRQAVPDRPLLIGSGVSASSVADWLALADGIIAGTAIKREAKIELPVDPLRARELVRAARGSAP